MKILSLETYAFGIPVKPENLSFGRVDQVHFVVTRVETGKFTGYGEAATLQGPTWSEESQETIKPIIDKYLSKVVVGNDTLDYSRISDVMDSRVKGNSFAKASVEMAILDAAGKEMNIPISSLLGARYRNSVPLSWTLANNDAGLDAEEAKDRVKRGWKILKIKTGSLPLNQDLERVKAVRAAVGDAVSIRVDANQGWNLHTAVAASKTLEIAQVAFLEQPLPRWDLDGLAEVSRRTSIPIMADEGVCTIQDATSLVNKRAVSVFGYKLTKMGGILNSKTIERIAASHGVEGYVGCMIETSIGTAAYLQFAAAVQHLEYGCELFGPLRLESDVARRGVNYKNGTVTIPDKPGIGIEVDENKLHQLSQSEVSLSRREKKQTKR